MVELPVPEKTHSDHSDKEMHHDDVDCGSSEVAIRRR